MGFKSTPIKAWVYPFASVSTAFIIGVIVSSIALFAYTACIYILTGYILTANIVGMSLLLILFSSLVNALLLGCICSFLKTSSAFSAISIFVGTIIGFINGLYVPIGSLNSSIVSVLAIFPSLHIATIFRKITTSSAMEMVFNNAPVNVIQNYSFKYGIELNVGADQIPVIFSLVFALVLGIVGLTFMIVNIRKKSKEL